MKRRFLLPLVLIAGCLPSRDNPHDPSLAPSAKLRATDTTLPDGTCGTSTVVSSNDVVVLAASRGLACLALDARQTTDPQGDEIAFEYSLIDDSGETLEVIPGDGPLAFLSDGFRRSHPFEEPLRFQVRASDAGGASRTAETLLTLENARPIAVAPLSRSLPRGGFPWTIGEPFRVAFDASASTDPDGDTDLQFCWTFPAELPPADSGCPQDLTLCRSNAADPCFTRLLQADAPLTRVTALLEVLDSSVEQLAKRSLTDRATVALGSPATYVAPGIDFGNYQRMDSLRRTYPDSALIDEDDSLAYLPQQDRLVSAHFAGTSLDLFSWPEGEPLASQPISVDPDPQVKALRDGSGFWIAQSVADEPQLVRWTLANDVFTPSTPIPSLALEGPFDLPILAVDNAGRAWRSSTQSSQILVASADGSSSLLPVEGTRILVGIAPRPGSDDVWAIQCADWIGGTTFESTLLIRYDDPDAPPQIVDAGPLPVSTFEWADEERIWMLVADRGLVLVDADLFFDTGNLDLATIHQLEVSVFFFLSAHIDAATGDVWFSDVIGNQVLRARTDGTLFTHSFAPQEPPNVLFIDEEGAVVTFEDGLFDSVLKRGLGIVPDGSVQTLPIIGRFNAAIDHGTGGLWVPAFFPSALMRVAEDGTVTSYENSMRYDGDPALYTFPPVEVFRTHSGSSTAWIVPLDFSTFQPSGMFVIDMEARPPVARTVLSAEELLSPPPLENGTNDVLFEVSSEIPGMTRFAWLGRTGPGSPGNGIPGRIFTLTTAGASSLTERFSIPANEVVDTMFSDDLVLHGALSPASSSLCFATLESDETTTANARLRRLHPDGSVELLATRALPPGASSIEGVAASADSARELCWLAFQDRSDPDPANWFTAFEAYSAPGVLWRSLTFTHETTLQSFVAPTTTKVFASFQTDSEGIPRRVILEDLTGSDPTTEVMIGERARFLGPDIGGR